MTGDTIPPCRAACPAGIDIPAFLTHLGHHHPERAAEVIFADNPLGHSCGLICPAPCESVCRRRALDGAVAIRLMKAVTAESLPGPLPHPTPAPATGFRVAIVGSGPAGLAAADLLARQGHAVTIFEALPVAGGMLRTGIPDWRLPAPVVEREIARITAMGVILTLGTEIRDPTRLRARGFDAVLLATGLPYSRPAPFSGGTVMGGVEFLRAVRLGDPPRIGGAAVVIGGGNVACDVAATAKRLGTASVTLISLESRETMPAHAVEIDGALADGVLMRHGWGVAAADTGGVTLHRCLSVFDSEGRFRPRFDAADTQTLPADTILLAIGQTGSPSPEGIDAVAGDLALGPGTVVAAVGSGKDAARRIHAALTGKTIDTPPAVPVAPLGPDAIGEPARCLRCDLCHGCGACEEACRTIGPALLWMTGDGAGRKVHIPNPAMADACLGCGACVAACPTGAMTLRDQGGQRVLLRVGRVLSRQPLRTCAVCGTAFATPRQTGETTCPGCRRVITARRLGGW